MGRKVESWEMCQVVKYRIEGFGEAKSIVEKIKGLNINSIENQNSFFNVPITELQMLFVAFDYQDKKAFKEALDYMCDKSTPDNRVIAVVLNNDKNPSKELENYSDLFFISNRGMKYAEDDILNVYVGVMSVVNTSSLINIDFHDFCTVTQFKHQLIVGMGEAEGAYRAKKAAEIAVAKLGVDNINDVLVSISADTSINLVEMDRSIDVVRDKFGGNVNVLFGTTIDTNLKCYRVTLLASV